MEKKQNHYKVLGVDQDANSEEIKHAYRVAVRKHHPDSGTGDSETFRRVQEAYEVLSDEGQRNEYDNNRPGSRIKTTTYPGTASDELVWTGEHFYSDPSIFDRFFSDVFGEFFEVKELSLDVILSHEEAMRGGEIPVTVPLYVQCPQCHGWGCIACFGSGRMELVKDMTIGYPAGIHSGLEKCIVVGDIVAPAAKLYVTFIISDQ